MLAAIPAAYRHRYVMMARDRIRQIGPDRPGIAAHVHFRHLNLMDQRYPFDRDVDVIFCRNVFDLLRQADAARRTRSAGRHLRPGGYLVVGHSESMSVAGVPDLTQVTSTVFRR